MEEWQLVLFCMDVPMLLWLSRTGYDQKVMDKGGWWFALYAVVMTAGCLYFLWSMSELCGGCNG
jgi:hypothetical protein